jgi:hypothetical protein
MILVFQSDHCHRGGNTKKGADPPGSAPSSATHIYIANNVQVVIYVDELLGRIYDSINSKCGRSSKLLSRTFQSLFQSPPHLITMPC